MKETDPILPALAGVVSAHQRTGAIERIVERRTAAGHKARQEHKSQVETLRESILGHPYMADFQKAAWVNAVAKHRNDPEMIELAATELADKLETLESVFAEPGNPVLIYGVGFGGIGIQEAFVTTDYGLWFDSRHEYSAMLTEIPRAESEQNRRLNFIVRDVVSVVASAEEVDDTQSEHSLDASYDMDRSGLTFVIGKEAITRFAERYYDAGFVPVNTIDKVLEKLNNVGVSLESRAELIEQDWEKHREVRARRIAETVFDRTMAGYDTAQEIEVTQDFIEKDHTTLPKVVTHLERIRDEKVSKVDELITGLQEANSEQKATS